MALANVRRHEYATIEHLLFALLDDPDASDVLVGCGADLERLRSQLIDFIDHELLSLVTEGDVDAKPTAGFQRIVQRAAIHVQSSGENIVSGANILVALFSERESHAAFFLQEQNLSRLDAINYLRGSRNERSVSSPHVLSVSKFLDNIVESAENGIVFIAETEGPQAALEELSDALEVIRIDVNWSWRVSESLRRMTLEEPPPHWVIQTIEQLRRWSTASETAGCMSPYLNTIEFDPLDQTILERPFVRFISARHFNPIELTISVTAASLTVVIMASLWALRTFKKIKADEGFAAAKTELLKRISEQIICKNPSQLKDIETLLLGLLNSPGGLHEKGDEIRYFGAASIECAYGW